MRTGAKVGSLIGGTWLCLHPSVIPQSWRQAHHHFPSPYIFTQSLFPVIPKAPELEIQGISRKSNFHIEDEDDTVELEVQLWMVNSSQKWENLAGPKNFSKLSGSSRVLRFPVDLGSKNFRQ